MKTGRPAAKAWASREAAAEKARRLMGDGWYHVACGTLLGMADAYGKRGERDDLKAQLDGLRRAGRSRGPGAIEVAGRLLKVDPKGKKWPTDVPKAMSGTTFRSAFVRALFDSAAGMLDRASMERVFSASALAYFAIEHGLAAPAVDLDTADEHLTASQVFRRYRVPEWRRALRAAGPRRRLLTIGGQG
jgi:hypothetical protein